jgi:hypothetical protein
MTEEFRVPDGLVYTEEILSITKRIANHIDEYSPYVMEDNFSKQFIVNFYYVLNDYIDDTNSLTKERAMDLLCDFSIGFLFTTTYLLKSFAHHDHESYSTIIEFIVNTINEMVDKADRIVPYWEEDFE